MTRRILPMTINADGTAYQADSRALIAPVSDRARKLTDRSPDFRAVNNWLVSARAGPTQHPST